MQRKTLNDHLFDQLDRLSKAKGDNVQEEIDKAASIISVSEQVLNVARLKLDIIQAGDNITKQFMEIDNTPLNGIENSISTPDEVEDDFTPPEHEQQENEQKESQIYNSIADTFPGLTGKKIKIFNGKDVFWASAEVAGCTKNMLNLKNVTFFNHVKKTAFSIEAKNITRIEIIETPE